MISFTLCFVLIALVNDEIGCDSCTVALFRSNVYYISIYHVHSIAWYNSLSFFTNHDSGRIPWWCTMNVCTNETLMLNLIGMICGAIDDHGFSLSFYLYIPLYNYAYSSHFPYLPFAGLLVGNMNRSWFSWAYWCFRNIFMVILIFFFFPLILIVLKLSRRCYTV